MTEQMLTDARRASNVELLRYIDTWRERIAAGVDVALNQQFIDAACTVLHERELTPPTEEHIR